jgi:predicted dehydrogenase
MTSYRRALMVLVTVSAAMVQSSGKPDQQLRLIEIDPGHGHLSGLHSKMLPGVSEVVHIYSPLSAELMAHLNALSRYNSRADSPTHWSVRLFAGPDYMEEMQQESPGAIVALSGRNNAKIRYIQTALKGGQNVFADKPWIIDSEAFPKLEAALKFAREKHLITYDWMTLRGDAAYRLVRDLVRQEPVFGAPVPGSIEKPSVQLENLHALLKYSNGIPQRRPASVLDVRQQGEGMADVGTHLADLAQWTLFPDREISYRTDIRVLRAEHSALMLTLEQFTRLTGESSWPEYLKQNIIEGKLSDYTNGSCVYTLKGVHVRLKVGWEFEAPPGAHDSYFASYLGTHALVELRAGSKENFIPEIYLTPAATGSTATWEAGLRSAVNRLQDGYPGLSFEKVGQSIHMLLPKADRGGDGLQKLYQEFAGFVRDPNTFPEFENSNLLAKYYITTTAVALAGARR